MLIIKVACLFGLTITIFAISSQQILNKQNFPLFQTCLSELEGIQKKTSYL
jgi:hypothetical protein